MPRKTSEDDRDQLERRKLDAETKKLACEIARLEQAPRESNRAHRLELYKTFFAAFTTILALSGLLYTALSQRYADQRAREVRRDDEFADAVKQLGNAKEELGRVAAVNAIAVFLSDPKYEGRVRSLLLQALPFVREPRTRTSIVEAFAQHPSRDGLSDLIQLNRALQQQIESRVSQRMSEAETNALLQDNSDERIEWDRKDYYRVLAWPNLWSRSDGKTLQELVEDLGWSAEAILAVMNSLRIVEKVDLSNVVLARLEHVREQQSDTVATVGQDPVQCTSVGVPADGLILRHVDLSNAVLACLSFNHSTFDNVTMNSATLYRSSFAGCTFSNVSLSSFRSWASFVNERDGNVAAAIVKRSSVLGPEWKDCDLTFSKFNARTPRYVRKVLHGEYFSFERCTWKIERPTGVATPPPSGRKGTFYGRVNP